MTTLSAMTDAALDDAYAAAVNKRDQAAISATVGEITSRLTSIGGFLRAFASTTPRFPKYSAHSGLNEGSAARTGTGANAANVMSSIGSGISSTVTGAGGVVGSTIFKATAPLMLAAVIGIVGLYVWKMPPGQRPFGKSARKGKR